MRQYAQLVANWGLSRTAGAPAIALALSALIAAGCGHDQNSDGPLPSAVQDCPGLAGLLKASIERPVRRQITQESFQRAGWQGGHERDGKPGSGLAVYYRFDSDAGGAKQLAMLSVALGDVRRAPALVTVYAIDGASLQAGDEHSVWRLQPGMISEIGLTAIVPASGGGLVAATCQDGKISMRNIPLPERQLHRQTPSGEYQMDASGNPIVNMQAPLIKSASKPTAQGHEGNKP